jgi:hypothetical protein
MTQRPDDAPAKDKQVWIAPELLFDGQLQDFVRSTNKPTTTLGESGDPGHKPVGQLG